MRLSTAVLGDNPFALRLPSALAGCLTCLLVWWWGRRVMGENVGFWGAVMLASAPIVVVESKLATTDALLALFVVVCQVALWELGQSPSWRWALAFWASMGLGILTKGPMAPALIVAAAPFMGLFGGGWVCWKRLHWFSGVVLCLAIAAPWFVAINILSDGEFYRVMIGDQVLRRASMGMEDHGGFPGYYLLTTLATFYPWSALIPASVVMAWRHRRSDRALGFLLGWAFGPLVLLECARTKLLHYYLPSYPACALLAAWMAVGLADRTLSWPRRWLGRITIGGIRWVGLVWVVGFVALAFVLPSHLKAPVALAAAVSGASWISGQIAWRQARTLRAIGSLAAGWTATALVLFGWLLPAAQPDLLTVQAGSRLRDLASKTGAQPVLAGFKPPGMVYLVGKPMPVLEYRQEWLGLAREKGAVVAALMPLEIERLRSSPYLSVETGPKLHGFDVEKFRQVWVQLSVVRPSSRALTKAEKSESSSSRTR
jgi:4-amino-4-deoxy-L-arabinose transferase-like glycosyltransferase